MARRWTAALIVTVLAGCDNVDWGGAHVAVVPPPPQVTDVAETTEGPVEEHLPEGPILYYVRPSGGRATLIPVAEISRDRLYPIRAAADWETYGQRFIAAHLRPGTEFTVFRRGARVGTLIVEQAGLPPEGVCPRTPRATGVLELIANAGAEPEFLAMAKSQAPAEVPRGVPEPIQPSRGMQVVSPILAERALRARGAPLPGSWQRAMAQLHPFPLEGNDVPAFASTFLVDDALEVGHDDDGYSLFLIAEPMQAGYDTTFVAFTDYPTEGKAAPRVVDYLDWDRDGQVELLLEVLGREGSWFAAMERREQGWSQALEPVCPRPRPITPDTAAQRQQTPPRQQRRPNTTSQAPARREPERAIEALPLPAPTVELSAPQRPSRTPTERPDTATRLP